MGLKTQKRRRLENKTDYKLRLNLLKSKSPRIVVRRTNKYFIVAAVESHEAQDKIIASVNSKDLLKKGWDKKKSGSLKSIPAGYLSGVLLAKKLGRGKFIMDLGMARTAPGSRVFAVVKGLVDGGLDISIGKNIFPNEERLDGEHLNEETKAMIAKVKESL